MNQAEPRHAPRVGQNCDEECTTAIETKIESANSDLRPEIDTGREGGLKWTSSEIANGYYPTLKLTDWLKLAGVNSLDELNNGVKWSASEGNPSYRLTGVQINIEAEFFNDKVRPRSRSRPRAWS